MSDTIIIHNDGEGQDVTAEAIESRRLIPGLTADLELKGGESPRLWVAEDAFIQPIYIVGADENTSVSPKRTTVSIPDQTTVALQIVNSGAIYNPHRLASFMFSVNVTAITGAAFTEAHVEYSWDGITWLRQLAYAGLNLVQANALGVGVEAIPPYIRLALERTAAVGNFTFNNARLTLVT